MATRRSRIKAVANLPARRNRAGGSSDVKKDDLTPAEASDFSSAPEIAKSSPSPKKLQAILEDESHLGKDGSPESGVSSCKSPQSALSNGKIKAASLGDPSTSEESHSAPDRRSVIVTVDKDRKSVIVNRDECVSPKKSASKESLCKTDIKQASPTDLNKTPEDDSAKQPLKALNGEGDATVSTVSPQGKQSEDKASISSEDTASVLNKRLPLRNRRSKPAVNITAATRKRAANDITASPCSPPPVKLKSPEPVPCRISDDSTTVAKSNDTPNQNLTSEAKNESIPSSFPVSSPSVAVSRPSDTAGGAFKTPTVPVPKIKDASNDNPNKGDGTPGSPPKESSSNIKRKPSSNAQRVATARKNLKNRIDNDGAPPRSALTMFDLIFYNPSKNPMKSVGTSSNKARCRLSSVSSVASIQEDRLNEESIDDIDETENGQSNSEETVEEPVEETAMPVPQVKVGPDGSLILDEQSLVIETTGAKKNREELEKSEVIVDSGTGYGHYKKVVRSKDWSDHETKKFYRALNVVGTDFSLMKPYFRTRTRRELKLKFKKEERLNPNLINKALAEPLDFDISELEKECELEDEEEKRLEEEAKEKAAEKLKEKTENVQDKTKKPATKKKKICVPLAEIGQETENSPETSALRRQKKRKNTDDDDLETSSESEIGLEIENGSAGSSSHRKKAKNAKQAMIARKNNKLRKAAEEDYNMLAMGLDMPSQPISPKLEQATAEQEEMGLFAEPKTNPVNTTTKEPSVNRVKRKVPNLPLKSERNPTAFDSPATSCSQPQSNIVQKSKEANLKVPSSTLSSSSAAVQSVTQSQIRTAPTNAASTSGFKLIQTCAQPQIQVVQASQQSLVPSPSFRVVQSSPQSRVQLVQSVQQTTPPTPPSLASVGAVTPRTYNIIRKPLTGVRPISTENLPLATPSSALPVSTLLSSYSSGSTCLVSSPGGKFQVQSPAASRVRTVQVTPQGSPNATRFGSTTPVDRLLPTTPLPRMEPGSIIVLKTPLPQNPDRHVLQVYMVTNATQGAPGNAIAHSPLVPGINLLSGPTVQPANLKSPPCMSDDSDCEKVLTTL